jgi:hypothetical protein
MKFIIKLPLVLLIILSLYMVVPINGDSDLLYLSEYHSIISIHRLSFIETLILILLLISHVFIFLLPFLTNNKNFSTILILAPIGFILSYFLFNIYSIIALFPFIGAWIVCLSLRKEFKSVSSSEEKI